MNVEGLSFCKKIEQQLNIFQRKQYNLSIVKFLFLLTQMRNVYKAPSVPLDSFLSRFIFALENLAYSNLLLRFYR